MRIRPSRWAAVAALGALAVTACGSGSTKASEHPLTGLPMAANDPAARRPALFVKVDNAFEARPQTGIEKADIVYEELVEAGITRFAAIFQSTDLGEVGPVRSVRPVDPALAAPLHGVAVFSGGIPAFVSQLAAVAQNLSAEQIGERPPYRRSRDRTAPHNLYVGAGGLWKLAQPPYNTPPAPVFAYGSLPSSGTKPAASAKMSFDSHNTIAWRWDGSVWRRSQNGRPFAVTGSASIGPANVLVQVVQVRPTQYVDVVGNSVTESVVTGTGSGVLLRNGTATDVTWSKPDQDSATSLTEASGNEVTLAPGSTWVELVPAGQPVTVTP